MSIIVSSVDIFVTFLILICHFPCLFRAFSYFLLHSVQENKVSHLHFLWICGCSGLSDFSWSGWAQRTMKSVHRSTFREQKGFPCHDKVNTKCQKGLGLKKNSLSHRKKQDMLHQQNLKTGEPGAFTVFLKENLDSLSRAQWGGRKKSNIA